MTNDKTIEAFKRLPLLVEMGAAAEFMGFDVKRLRALTEGKQPVFTPFRGSRRGHRRILKTEIARFCGLEKYL